MYALSHLLLRLPDTPSAISDLRLRASTHINPTAIRTSLPVHRAREREPGTACDLPHGHGHGYGRKKNVHGSWRLPSLQHYIIAKPKPCVVNSIQSQPPTWQSSPPPPRRFCPILICSDLFPCGTGIHSLPLWHPSPPRSSATCPSAIMVSASASLALSFIFQSYTLRFLQNVPEHNHGYSTYVHSGTAHKITTRIICLPFANQSSNIYL